MSPISFSHHSPPANHVRSERYRLDTISQTSIISCNRASVVVAIGSTEMSCVCQVNLGQVGLESLVLKDGHRVASGRTELLKSLPALKR